MIMKRFFNCKDHTVEVSFDGEELGRIDSDGLGKTVTDNGLNAGTEMQRKYASVGTLTEADLKILDDAEPGSSDEGEYDPYKSGSFDTSKMWWSRSHK